MIGVNKVGKGGRDFPGTFGGHSAVFGPWGEKLGELGAKAGVLTIKLDLSRCKKIRKQYPFLDSRILG
jgi:predicted amidohydrolase